MAICFKLFPDKQWASANSPSLMFMKERFTAWDMPHSDTKGQIVTVDNQDPFNWTQENYKLSKFHKSFYSNKGNPQVKLIAQEFMQ